MDSFPSLFRGLQEQGGGHKQRVFQKAKTPLDFLLILVRFDQVLIG